jgi:hypothetical protein
MELHSESKLILADLSGTNPNVFYELGLAHALTKPAILITESIEDIPFDLRALRVLEYDKNIPDWGIILQEKITKSIMEVVASPLQAVLPTFLDTKHDSKQKPVPEQEKMLLEIRSELDLLRREMSMSQIRNYTRRDIVKPRDAIYDAAFKDDTVMLKQVESLVRQGISRSIILGILSSKFSVRPTVGQKIIDVILSKVKAEANASTTEEESEGIK